MGEGERKDGVFDTHSDAGRRGPQVGEGERTPREGETEVETKER